MVSLGLINEKDLEKIMDGNMHADNCCNLCISSYKARRLSHKLWIFNRFRSFIDASNKCNWTFFRRGNKIKGALEMNKKKEIGGATVLGILAGASVGGPVGAIIGGLIGFVLDNPNNKDDDII